MENALDFRHESAMLTAWLRNPNSSSASPGFERLAGWLRNKQTSISEQLAKEQQRTIAELESLRENIEHIKEIVAMQQNYATVWTVNGS